MHLRARKVSDQHASLVVLQHIRHTHEARPLHHSYSGLLVKVVDLIDHLPMEERDTKGDLYEHMLSKIATAGQNGQFRTPLHIIQLMVEMVKPMPTDYQDS